MTSKTRALAGRWRRIAVAALLLLGTGCGGDELWLAGTVERKTIELAAPVSETIAKIHGSPGERVEADQVIVELDSEVAEAELLAAESGEVAAKAARTEAQQEYGRLAELRRSKVIPQQQLDAAKRNLDEAVALVAERAARVAQAQKRLRDLTVRSYAPGTLDELPFEEGERASAGGVVAVVLADEDPWVRVWLPARAVARAAAGSPAEVTVEGFDGVLRGVLEDVAREPEFTPHYALTERESAFLVYESRVRLLDAPAELRPGLPAQVRLRPTAGG